MKLCNRCPIYGVCSLNYLGKACRKVRKGADPSLRPTNLEIFDLFDPAHLRAYLEEHKEEAGITDVEKLFTWLMQETEA